jgi:hypothetical protein
MFADPFTTGGIDLDHYDVMTVVAEQLAGTKSHTPAADDYRSKRVI